MIKVEFYSGPSAGEYSWFYKVTVFVSRYYKFPSKRVQKYLSCQFRNHNITIQQYRCIVLCSLKCNSKREILLIETDLGGVGIQATKQRRTITTILSPTHSITSGGCTFKIGIVSAGTLLV